MIVCTEYAVCNVYYVSCYVQYSLIVLIELCTFSQSTIEQGYFRKGEVECAVEHYKEAMETYGVYATSRFIFVVIWFKLVKFKLILIVEIC